MAGVIREVNGEFFVERDQTKAEAEVLKRFEETPLGRGLKEDELNRQVAARRWKLVAGDRG